MNPSIWGLAINSQDHLVLGGCDLLDLAKHYGTPLYVVNEERLRDNYQHFRDAFGKYFPRLKVFYSYKTNCIPGVLTRLHREGCGAEVVSPYELWLALRLGVEPSQIVYNGVNKSIQDLTKAIEVGVGLINIDSAAEARILSKVAAASANPANVGIRIYPKRGWRGQFGLQPTHDQVIEVCRQLASNKHCQVICLHAHIGSGLQQTDDYVIVAQSLCHLAEQIQNTVGVPIKYLNLGGGFGVPSVKTLSLREVAQYKLFNRPPRSPNVQACPSREDFAAAIAGVLRKATGNISGERPALLLEPGRAITSDAQVLLVTVRDIKERSDGRIYAITDGGLQNVAFPLSYEYHHCLVANRADTLARRRYFVTGPLCSPEDILYRNWPLPELSIGDVLAVMDAGAYFTSFANNFSFPRPATVVVSNGRSDVLRQRETFEQMTAMDVVEGLVKRS